MQHCSAALHGTSCMLLLITPCTCTVSQGCICGGTEGSYRRGWAVRGQAAITEQGVKNKWDRCKYLFCHHNALKCTYLHANFQNCLRDYTPNTLARWANPPVLTLTGRKPCPLTPRWNFTPVYIQLPYAAAELKDRQTVARLVCGERAQCHVKPLQFHADHLDSADFSKLQNREFCFSLWLT